MVTSRINLGILVAFLLLTTVVVGIFSYFLARIQRQSVRMSAAIEQVAEQNRQLSRNEVLPESTRRVGRRLSESESNERIRELRVLLDERTRELQRKNDEFHRQSQEYQSLQAETDRYFTLVQELILDPPKISPDATSPDADPQAASSPASNEKERDAEELRLALEMLATSEQELTDVRRSLQNAQSWSDDLESGLINSAEVAVPSLVALLVSPSADVRAWSASMLGRIGAGAVGAVTVLRATAIEDPEPEVRNAVKWALTQIEPHL